MWHSICRPNKKKNTSKTPRTHLQHQQHKKTPFHTKNTSCCYTFWSTRPQWHDRFECTHLRFHFCTSIQQTIFKQKTHPGKEMDTYLEMPSTLRPQHDGLTGPSGHQNLPVVSPSKHNNLHRYFLTTGCISFPSLLLNNRLMVLTPAKREREDHLHSWVVPTFGQNVIKCT